MIFIDWAISALRNFEAHGLHEVNKCIFSTIVLLRERGGLQTWPSAINLASPFIQLVITIFVFTVQKTMILVKFVYKFNYSLSPLSIMFCFRINVVIFQLLLNCANRTKWIEVIFKFIKKFHILK